MKARSKGLTDNEYQLGGSHGRYEIDDLLDVGLPPFRMKVIGARAMFEIDELFGCNKKTYALPSFRPHLKSDLHVFPP